MKWLFRSHTTVTLKNIDENCTSFNDFNNDLFFEIFDYLSYNDILLSFGNLNNYFDQLIKLYPHSIDFRSHDEFPNHIRSLKISGSYQLSLFYSFEYSQFESLRSITFGNLRPQEVLNVLNNVPFKQLEYIYLGVCAFHGRNNKTNIQTEILALTQYRLKQCYLKEKFSILIDDLPEILFSLEYLQLVSCQDLFIVSQILSRSPNLKYLHVSTNEIHQNPLIVNRFYLNHLSIRPHIDCSLKELGTFLIQCCPHLNKLIVELYIYRGKQPCLLVNKHQWITIFPSRLTYFHLKSLSSSSIHFVKMKDEPFLSPLREKICLILRDVQVMIDGPLISVWTNK